MTTHSVDFNQKIAQAINRQAICINELQKRYNRAVLDANEKLIGELSKQLDSEQSFLEELLNIR